MNINDNSNNEDKICPHCKKTFSSHSARNKHLQKNVCQKSGSSPGSTRNSRPSDPPAVILTEDHEGLLLGHTCPYSKYNIFSFVLFNIKNLMSDTESVNY